MKVTKLLSWVLALAMMLTCVGVVSAEEPAWTGNVDTSWYVAGETEFKIDSADALAGLAELVNGGTDSFAGKTVNLTTSIDLNQIDWTSIGTAANPFLGTFDGQGNTIYNLWGGENQNGLFGYTSTGNRAENYGTEAIIKNFTIDGAVMTDNFQAHEGSAAVVGCGNMYTTIKNVNVKGQIIVTGARAGGILGYAYSGARIDNCHVDGACEENDSRIHALYWACGGIMGFGAPSDGDVEITNCSAKNIEVNAVNHYCAGGILGVGGNGKVENVTVENVECSIAYGDNIFYVSGGPTATGEVVVVAGTVAKVNGEVVEVTAEDLSNVKKIVASFNGEYYETLKSAIDAAKDGGTIYLYGVIEEGAIKLPATLNNVVIDGQGTATVKNTTINASDGGSVVYKGLTIKNTTFENSRFVLGGMRTGEVLYQDLVFDNNKFLNIVNTGSMAAIHMNVDTDEKIENFTFTNNVIDGVSGASNSGVLLKAVDGTILFENNTVSNVAWNAVQIATSKESAHLIVKNNEFQSNGSSVLNIASVPKLTISNNVVTALPGKVDVWYPAEAMIDEVTYKTIGTAIADAEDGDTITILAGTYNAFTVPADKNNLTIVGETDAEGNNLVTIKTLENGIATHTGGIYVQAENATFKNLNITSGTVAPTWMASAIGNTNNETGMVSKLKNLTIENVNFKGSAAYQAVWTIRGNVTVKDSTIENYVNGVDNYAIGANDKLVIDNVTITDVNNAFHTGEAVAGSVIEVKNTIIDTNVIDVGGAVAVSITDSEIANAKVNSYGASTISISETVLTDTAFDVVDTGAIVLNGVYANNMNELAASIKGENITIGTYYKNVEDMENGVASEFPVATDAIYVQFEETAVGTEGERTYNINLVATDDEIINRLNSVDLTFLFNQVSGNNTYEIIESNSEVEINPVNNSTTRYEFHYDGKDDTQTDTANKITLGQVKFTGYGVFSFTVDSTATTNVAHATTVADNIVDTFVPNDDTTTVAVGELVIADNTINKIAIKVPTRDLTINVAFPNAVVNNPVAYQDMKVVISGDDLAPVTMKLGTDNAGGVIVADNRPDAAYTVAFTNGGYVVTVTDALTVNTSYDIVVSGAGYRTARYTVNMQTETAKTVNFWNNVKDADADVEAGKFQAKKNFLAGDIVKDNNINVYDLSAVVSYFGETGLVGTNNAYAKYDLNRDGFIDSKDVAMVLVSWNN